MTALEPTRTAPDFAVDPLGYYRWHLSTHPGMYAEFRRLADTYRLTDPRRRVSADMVCHVIRYHSGLRAEGDQFQVNNVLTPLYARLYKRERPGARIETRASQLDTYDDETWAGLLALLPEEASREPQ
ncbi:hypothetical protein DAERI_060131 [Deinococcus aerius]|uniref:Uncharacterized protein n=1 Tax=Deinococcus aerius TaxID=200253 RepID=A0A2I9DLL9_9DEIO|nr:hypothetical protein [Deinococcus aerius]GBF05871.1 hypothetical protein DAERI_060131 [Deinococcus aerius]